MTKKLSRFSKIPSQIEGKYQARFLSNSIPSVEHDWEAYLIETDSEAAPAGNFKQVCID